MLTFDYFFIAWLREKLVSIVGMLVLPAMAYILDFGLWQTGVIIIFSIICIVQTYLKEKFLFQTRVILTILASYMILLNEWKFLYLL